MNYTPENITKLNPNQVFVFGSNLDGRHGKGAALTAVRKFGAAYGKCEGLHNQSYALPTVGHRLSKMPLRDVGIHCRKFIKFAAAHPQLEFLVTPVGCGLAGYKPREIAPYFFSFQIPPNVILPKCFHDAWEKLNMK